MKRINMMKVAVFLVLALFASASYAAQDAKDNEPGAAGPMMNQGALRVSQLMDRTVKDQQGDDLGQIEDVFFDNQGRALYGILAGPDNKYYPVPMQTLLQGMVEEDFVLNMNKDRIHAAPNFPRDEWPEQLSGSEWEQRVFSYYGAQSPSGKMTSPQSEGMTQPRGRESLKEQPPTGAQPRTQ